MKFCFSWWTAFQDTSWKAFHFRCVLWTHVFNALHEHGIRHFLDHGKCTTFLLYTLKQLFISNNSLHLTNSTEIHDSIRSWLTQASIVLLRPEEPTGCCLLRQSLNRSYQRLKTSQMSNSSRWQRRLRHREWRRRFQQKSWVERLTSRTKRDFYYYNNIHIKYS